MLLVWWLILGPSGAFTPLPLTIQKNRVDPIFKATSTFRSSRGERTTAYGARILQIGLLPDHLQTDAETRSNDAFEERSTSSSTTTENNNEEADDETIRHSSPSFSSASVSALFRGRSASRENKNANRRKPSANTDSIKQNLSVLSRRKGLSTGGGSSLFDDSNKAESILLPSPSSVRKTSSSTGHKRVHMRRGKDNSRHYYPLRTTTQPVYREGKTKSSWKTSSKRATTDRLRAGSTERQQPSRESGGFIAANTAGNNTNSSFASLLPPPLSESTLIGSPREDDAFSPGLSSWEDFLGTASPVSGKASKDIDRDPTTTTTLKTKRFSSDLSTRFSKVTGRDDLKQQARKNRKRENRAKVNTAKDELPQRLPAFKELFPPSLSSSPPKASTSVSQSTARGRASTSSPPLEGVLPVSDLFFNYAATSPHKNQSPSLVGADSNTFSSSTSKREGEEVSRLSVNASAVVGLQQPSREQLEMIKTAGKRKETGRKMVRRGMEMLVGGVPVRADPPQRAVEIFYNGGQDGQWASAICTNTDEFGPLLCRSEVASVSKFEQGLFCEYFANTTIKWDVCPNDLKEIVQSESREPSLTNTGGVIGGVEPCSRDESRLGELNEADYVNDQESYEDRSDVDYVPTHDEEDQDDGMLFIVARPHSMEATQTGMDSRPPTASFSNHSEDVQYEFHIGKIEIEINVPRPNLYSSARGQNDIMASVLLNGVHEALGDRLTGMDLNISHFAMIDLDSGSTKITAGFVVRCNVQPGKPDEEIVQLAKDMVAAFANAAEGEISLGAAHAARRETRWPPETREYVANEFLDDECDDEEECDGDDRDVQDASSVFHGASAAEDQGNNILVPTSRELILPTQSDELTYRSDNVLFYNYSAANALSAPYKGEIGLRLADAVTERAKERLPRVIAIGDVHGCIDELKDLLRQCDYRPGDLVVFLGDLVHKGPDSISVVQMAREIGAIGVRGNHDFEVIRWHRAIQAGVDPSSPRSEHFFIASRLAKEDIEWLYNLPWYISSTDLSALFVHAGFVSGIRLGKQNPRLMMNMRSILPDGTVTSKCFNNWPWARLWDGPQTVLFGHDADRGLQQYEHAIGLDTGCVYGGRLTACILPERRFVSVNARRRYSRYRRKHYD